MAASDVYPGGLRAGAGFGGRVTAEACRVTGLPFPLCISAGVGAGLHRCVRTRRAASLLFEWAGLGFLPEAFAGRDCRGARSGECRVDGGPSRGTEDASGFSADGKATRNSDGMHHEDSQRGAAAVL